MRDDFIAVKVDLHQTVRVAAQPVTFAEFSAFLQAAGRPLPKGVRRASSGQPGGAPSGGSQPVIGVAQPDAAAYCEWAGKRIGKACRLPSIDELDSLMPHTMVTHAHGVVPDAGFWPHEQGQLAEVRGGLKPLFLCEWTRDVLEAVSRAHPERVMALIFYPPWMREGDNMLHVHAALLASESYSFVTFRVSYEE